MAFPGFGIGGSARVIPTRESESDYSVPDIDIRSWIRRAETLESYFSIEANMIRKLATGGYRLYSRKKNPSTGKRRNLGTFKTRDEAAAHERAVQYFKHH